jgi:hypothetical protein
MLASLPLLAPMLLLANLCLASFVPYVLTVAVLPAIASVLDVGAIPNLLLLYLLSIAFLTLLAFIVVPAWSPCYCFHLYSVLIISTYPGVIS